MVGLKFGADFVVDNSVAIASRLGLTEKFIGMTIVAIGTALPEIITGVIAAKNDKTDILLGNVSGSNILNLCLLIGIGAIISPLKFSKSFNISLLILIAITIFLQAVTTINKENKLNKKRGLILIIIYIIYIISMVFN